MCIWVTAKAKAVWSAFKRTHRPFFFLITFLIKRQDLFSECVCVCVGHCQLEANKHALPLWWWWGRVIHHCSCKDLWEANYLTRLIAARIPPADNCFGYLRGHCIDYFCSSILYPIINKAILLLVYVTCNVSVKFHVIYWWRCVRDELRSLRKKLLCSLVLRQWKLLCYSPDLINFAAKPSSHIPFVSL